MNWGQFGAILFWTGIGLGMSLIILFAFLPTKTKQVDCYDRYSNKIIGVQCEKESPSFPVPLWVITVTLIILGGLIVTGEILWMDNNRSCP
jgi:hypothetical protein